MAQIDPQKVINRLAMQLANTQVQLAIKETELEDATALLAEAHTKLTATAPAPDGD